MMVLAMKHLLLTTVLYRATINAQQILNGSVIIPLIDTYRLLPNFTGNASEGYVSIQTPIDIVSTLLTQPKNATFISYDEKFSQIIGPHPEALLVVEQADAFAYGRVWTGESEGIVVRNTNGKVIGLFNQLTLKDQKVKTAIAQLALAGDSVIILAQTKLWRVKLTQVEASPGSFGN